TQIAPRPGNDLLEVSGKKPTATLRLGSGAGGRLAALPPWGGDYGAPSESGRPPDALGPSATRSGGDSRDPGGFLHQSPGASPSGRGRGWIFPWVCDRTGPGLGPGRHGLPMVDPPARLARWGNLRLGDNGCPVADSFAAGRGW